jgi:hypothetical protein
MDRPAQVLWLHSWRQHISVVVADAKATGVKTANPAREPETFHKPKMDGNKARANDHA